MLTLLLIAPVHAHAGAEITAIDWSPAGVEASFGLLLPGADGLDWVCHEAVTTPESLLAPRYSASPDGVWLASVPKRDQSRDLETTLFRSAEGCAWEAVSGVEPYVVSAVSWVDAQVAVAVTADLEGAANGILRSEDGGLSWTQVQPWEGARVSVGVASAGSQLWTASFVVDATDQAQLHRSQDRGLSWSTTDLDLSAVAPESGTLSVKVLAADEAHAWVGVGLSAGHQVLRVGASQDLVLAQDGALVDGGVDTQGGVWIVEANRELLYAADGENFSAVEGGVPAIGVAMDGDAAMLSGSAVLTEGLVFSFTPQGTLQEVYAPSDVLGPLDCPGGTEGADVCGPLWEKVLLPAPDTGEGPEDSTPWSPSVDTGEPGGQGCGCSSLASTAGGGWVLLVGLLLLGRRRE